MGRGAGQRRLAVGRTGEREQKAVSIHRTSLSHPPRFQEHCTKGEKGRKSWKMEMSAVESFSEYNMLTAIMDMQEL